MLNKKAYYQEIQLSLRQQIFPLLMDMHCLEDLSGDDSSMSLATRIIDGSSCKALIPSSINEDFIQRLADLYTAVKMCIDEIPSSFDKQGVTTDPVEN